MVVQVQHTSAVAGGGVHCSVSCRSFGVKRPSNLYTYYDSRLTKSACKGVSTENASVYQDWARRAGVVFPKVQQGMIGDIRGMVALDDVNDGEMFVVLPRSASLVVDPLEKCPCSDFVEPEYYKKCPWFVKMAVLLLSERQKGSSSRVSGYIKQLPDSIDTPVRWEDKELEQLQSASLKASVMKQKKEWKGLYDDFKSHSKGLGGAKETYDDFLWALENVRSRSFSGPYAGSPLKERVTLAGLLAVAGLGYAAVAHIPLESVLNAGISVACFNLVYDIVLSSRLKWYAMCPIIDSLNHDGKVSSSIEYEYFKDTFVVSTNRRYSKGSQIFISYGEKTNEQLLQYYGFIEKENPHDVYKLDAKIGGISVCLSVKPNGQLTKDTMEELEKNTTLRESVSGKFSEAVNYAIVESARMELDGKATSLEDDERLLNSPGMIASDRMALALAFRVSQKEILENALSLARKRK